MRQQRRELGRQSLHYLHRNGDTTSMLADWCGGDTVANGTIAGFFAAVQTLNSRAGASLPGVFLSYAREDLPFARRLHDALSAAGRDPAWDQDHAVVPFSAPYQSEIAVAITGSEKFVFVISPDSLDSGP